jgi:sRNA-binding regulator protein Hfq
MEDLPKTEIEELNTVLTQEECVIMSKEFLKERKNNKTKQTIFLITNQKYMEMIECFNNRMISNMLNNLVNKGLLETAYDSESNDFVFWIKDNDKNQNEKPETD